MINRLIQKIRDWHHYYFYRKPGNIWTQAEVDRLARYVIKRYKSGTVKTTPEAAKIANQIFKNLYG
jgi:hypothetical protein